MSDIQSVKFDDDAPNNISKLKYGKDWPVVYIINNDEEAYVGETTNAMVRTNQHLANEVRRNLKNIHIISDDTFNKSVILDLESFLIKYMSADNMFKLQNGNSGMAHHNYYNRNKYEKGFTQIWDKLKVIGLARQEILEIENSDLFKYSPYKALSDDQYITVNSILNDLVSDIKNRVECSIVVNGEPGTGKTVLGIYLMKLLAGNNNELCFSENDKDFDNYKEISDELQNLKIGLVIPMNSLRQTLKNVFKEIKGLSANMVISPNDASKEKFDLLIVDEAHRLRRRKNLSSYGYFDANNVRLGLDKEATELDWIMASSKYQILFYDRNQSIKPTDVRFNEFDKLKFGRKYHTYKLESQLRCKGGNDYIEYVKAIFSDNPPTEKKQFYDYDLRFFDDVAEMINEIKILDKKYGLCRAVAGYSWKWNTKGMKPYELLHGEYDIEIEGNKYIWNTTAEDWVNSPNAINEIGCIHTIQGYDLNYAGIILGNEIKYSDELGIYAERSEYFDNYGKELNTYIINIYTTMLTRGIKGTFIYVCNKELREYLRKYLG